MTAVAVIVALFGIFALAIPLYAISGHLQVLAALVREQNEHFEVGSEHD